jgi:hypothetical protein
LGESNGGATKSKEGTHQRKNENSIICDVHQEEMDLDLVFCARCWPKRQAQDIIYNTTRNVPECHLHEIDLCGKPQNALDAHTDDIRTLLHVSIVSFLPSDKLVLYQSVLEEPC